MMIVNTHETICLVIKKDGGFCIETFKTTESLLKAIITKHFNEQLKDFDTVQLCHLKIKNEIHKQLTELVNGYKDEPEEVCPVSGAKNCHECDDNNIKICQGGNIGNHVKDNSL